MTAPPPTAPAPNDETRILVDAEARRRIREDLHTTLFIEAAAGTGKTTELVARVLALVREGNATLDRVVAVTFTEKAAGEMKLRVRGELERARLNAGTTEERRRLDAAVEHLELAHIGTIHGFCADLLRERPVEAGVDPLFEVAEEDEQSALIDRAFDAWFERALSDPGEGTRRALRRRPEWRSDPGPRARLREAVSKLIEHRDFPAAWRRDPFDREAAIDRILDRLTELGELAPLATRRNDWLQKNLENVRRFSEENRLREEVRGRDHDALESDLKNLANPYRTGWNYKGFGDEYGKGLSRASVVQRRDQVLLELQQVIRDLDADLAPLIREELLSVTEAYEVAKLRAGKLDFVDLLLKARDLIRADAAVRADLQRRFTHFFVDEFQDTDPLQAELLLLLSADDPTEDQPERITPVPGKLFLVGDPKQSIYRFRRADVAIYERIKDRLVARGAVLLHLQTSFRSVPAIQQAVNASFAPHMSGGGSQAVYVPLESFRPACPGQPAVVALPVPMIYAPYGKVVNGVIDESFPHAVAAFVDWLIHESGWSVTDRDRPGELVPVAARHVCLLFRRMQKFGEDVTRPYVRALEARRTPHVLVGGRSFHEREEVLALRNLLCAIEWPDDELRVFAALRGPLLALSDDALLAYRDQCGPLHPLRPPRAPCADPDLDAVFEALQILGRFHRRRNRHPIARLLQELLAELRAHAGIAIWPTGEQALANVMRVIDLARRFEARGAASFRAFAEKIEDDAGERDTQEAPAVEEGTEGVRIMTVHKAKGLEFPVVILVDPTCKASRAEPSRHVDPERRLHLEALCGCAPAELLEQRDVEVERDRQEAVRLAYVAATRARDLLVVPVVGDGTTESWVEFLDDAIYPAAGARRSSSPVPGCPAFGEDTLIERPEKAAALANDTVRPGLHRPRLGAHEVVWWDPHVLHLERDLTGIGLRQQRILEADDGGPSQKEAEIAHDRWQQRRALGRDRGRLPSRPARTVTEASHDPVGPTGDPSLHPIHPVEVARTDVPRSARPHGTRFGELVHATLETTPVDADLPTIEAIARAQGRLVGASADEIRHAAAATQSALTHELLARARSAEVFREVPVAMREADGRVLEGVVDLAFREQTAEGARWTVIDFKTDIALGERQPAYERQVRLYAQAIEAATGEPARPILLLV